MPPRKTDNSHLATKVALRVDAVRDVGKPHVRVVDAFAGDGVVWRTVQEQLGDTVTVERLAIDRKAYSGATVISADNRKVLAGLDYASFDLVDLDAYGVPTDQLRIVAQRAPDLPVLVTCIAHFRAPVNAVLLNAAGLPPSWRRNAPRLLFGRWRRELWDNYAATLGYTHTRRYTYKTPGMLKVYELLTRERPTKGKAR